MRAKRSSLAIPYKAGTAEYQREWRKLNPRIYTDEQKKVKRDKALTARYKITPEEYKERFNQQNGCCAICTRYYEDQPKAMAVDHCHETGKVRGLLCFNCNRAIGLLKDNPDLLREAANYLELNGTTTI